jgi:hypothetical protein
MGIVEPRHYELPFQFDDPSRWAFELQQVSGFAYGENAIACNCDRFCAPGLKISCRGHAGVDIAMQKNPVCFDWRVMCNKDRGA